MGFVINYFTKTILTKEIGGLTTIKTQKDREFFNSLYMEHKGFMFNIANRVLNDRHAAEDVVHDAFVKIIENWEKYDLQSERKIKGLIFTIVYGFAVDEYRRRKRLPLCDKDAEDIHDDSAATDDQIIQLEQYESLREHLNQLKPIYFNALILSCCYEFSIKEIAEITNVSEETSRQRLHRAKLKIKKLLTKEG